MRPSRFVDAELEGRESDLLFAVNLDGSEALIYVLVEHQSRVDWTMPVRLLRYMASAWERYVEEHPSARKVPPVIPVVVYHSAAGWTVPTRLGELFDTEDDLRQEIAPYLPDFEFVLHDLAREDLDALRTANLPARLKFSLFLLQGKRGNAALESELIAWTSVARQLADETLRLVMSYVLAMTEVLVDGWRELVKSGRSYDFRQRRVVARTAAGATHPRRRRLRRQQHGSLRSMDGQPESIRLLTSPLAR